MAAENTQHLQLEEGEQIFTNCAIGGAVFVHVKDGRITKVRPIVFNEEDTEAWSIEAKGKTFTPPRKLSLGNYVCTMKSRIYSENRIQYPMLRVDFDPNGDRHVENRGKSGYKRITWDEALDEIAAKLLEHAANLRLEQHHQHQRAVAENLLKHPGKGGKTQEGGKKRCANQQQKALEHLAGAGIARKHDHLIDQHRDDQNIQQVVELRTIEDVPEERLELAEQRRHAATTSLSCDTLIITKS